LSLATALSLRDNHLKLPAALFLLSPWTDLTFSGESIRTRADRDPLLRLNDDDWLVKVYANGRPLDHPYISPLFGDMHDLPPTFIQVGTEEILFDDSTRLEQKARGAGVNATLETWPGMWHVFQGFAPYVPESQQAIEKIGEFLRANL
jgi:acetyl esterase/lipase